MVAAASEAAAAVSVAGSLEPVIRVGVLSALRATVGPVRIGGADDLIDLTGSAPPAGSVRAVVAPRDAVLDLADAPPEVLLVGITSRTHDLVLRTGLKLEHVVNPTPEVLAGIVARWLETGPGAR